MPVLVYKTFTTPSNYLIVVFYLKRLTNCNIRTFNRPANCQISYRLLKFKGLKLSFSLTYIEGRSLDLIFTVCFCLVMCNSTPLSRFRIHRPSVENSLVLIVASVKYNRRSGKNIENCFFHINLRPRA